MTDLDTLVSNISELTQTMAQVVSWIKKVEKSGVVSEGVWESSGKDVLRLRLADEISEVRRLLRNINSPDLEELLTMKLERLEWEQKYLDRS